MLSIITELFSYGFIVRAMLVGALVALCAALLGVSLVLKRYSMIGDGLAHVAFGSLSIAVGLGASPLQVSIPVVIIAAFFLLKLSENSKLKGDAAIALISTTALAFGIIVTSLTNGMNVDVLNYMFGSILAMSQSEVYISVFLSIIVLTVFVFFYNKIFSITFDEHFAKAIGIKVEMYRTILAVLTAVTIVVGMRIMGTMLISSLIVFPVLTSMRVFKSFRAVVLSSAVTGVICLFAGITLSYVVNLPAGPSIVATNFCAFVLFYIVGHLTKRT